MNDADIEAQARQQARAERAPLIEALQFFELHKGAAAKRALLRELTGCDLVRDVASEKIGPALDAVNARIAEHAVRRAARR